MAVMTDAELIRKLGGPRKVCELLGYDLAGGHAKVCNWVHRGIPWKVKAERAALFEMALAAARTRKAPKVKAKRKSRAT